MTASQCHLSFKNWHCVFPEDGTRVPKHAGDVHVMFVLMNIVHLVGTTDGVR